VRDEAQLDLVDPLRPGHQLATADAHGLRSPAPATRCVTATSRRASAIASPASSAVVSAASRPAALVRAAVTAAACSASSTASPSRAW
jgi:hypothetical protein